MTNLPIAASLATRLVERQFTYGQPEETAAPVTPVRQPVRHTRAAVAGALEWAARVVAPDGYRVAH